MNNREASQAFQEAQQLFAEERFGESLARLEELDAAFPDTKHILFAKARCLGKLWRNAEAEAICDRLITEFGDARAQGLKNSLSVQAPLEFGTFDILSNRIPPVHASKGSDWPDWLPYALSAVVAVVVLGIITGGLYLWQQDLSTQREAERPPVASQPSGDAPSAEREEVERSPLRQRPVFQVNDFFSANQPEEITPAYVAITLIFFLLIGFPLYTVLALFNKLPYNSIGKDLAHTFGVAVGVGIVTTFCPYIGLVLGLVAIHRIYDIGFTEIVIMLFFNLLMRYLWLYTLFMYA